jgi:hypothetical protein
LSRSVLPAVGGTTTLRVNVRNAKTCWFTGMVGITVPSAHQNCAHGTVSVTAQVAPSDSAQLTHLHVEVSAAGSNGSVVTADAYVVENSFPPLKIITASLVGAGVGKKYSHQLEAQGGRAPYKWQLASGTLPANLTLSTKGVLAGTPTTVGSFPLNIEVTDSSRPTALTLTAQLTLAVAPAPLVITTKSLPGGATESAYSATLQATGGVLPYSWKWLNGQLPPGLTLSNTGDLSGTPTGGGTYHFVVQVTDSAPSPQTDAHQFHITITTTPLIISTKSLPGATINSAFSATLMANGGVPPYTWSLDSGQLPSGVTLSNTGALTGTPTIPGDYEFKVKVNDSSPTPQATTATFKLVVAEVPLEITTNSLVGGTVGSAYSETLTASGGTAPYYWTVASGSLPNGITLSTIGDLTGTPISPGTSQFSIKVTDSSPHPESTTFAYKLEIAPVSLLVATTALPAATTHSPYTAPLITSGGTAPYTWKKTSGTLPTGIKLSTAGNLSGVASSAGTYTFTVQVTDSSPKKETATASLTMIVGNGPTSWSGYIQTGTYSSVTGAFTVPNTISYAQGQIAPSTASSAVSEWVGLDGATGPSIIDAGVTEVFTPTASPEVTITPWWSTSGKQTPIVMTVQGGDSITVDIFRVSDNTWAITLDDNTSKQDFRTETTYGGPGATADYVVGAPVAPSGTPARGTSTSEPTTTVPVAFPGTSVYHLASYSPAVNFTVLQTSGRTKATAAVVLVQGGVQVSTPSEYTPDGFAVAYGSVAPPAP